MMKEYFTTGQISTMTKTAPRTVSNWIDKGELPGRRLPLSKDRRVNRSDLLEFLKKHKYDAGLITMFDYGKAILFYGFREPHERDWFDPLHSNYVTEFEDSSFDMAFKLGRHKPNYLVVNCIHYQDGPSIESSIKKLDESVFITIIKNKEDALAFVARLQK